MSNHERQDEQLINMVNGTRSKAKKRHKDHQPEKRQKDDLNEEARYHMLCRIRGFQKVLVDVGGYIGLGGLMLIAMALGIVPWYFAVPVFTACWIWSALRIDRYFRW